MLVTERAMATEDDTTITTWRDFAVAHARVTRRINRDLADAGLPDLAWYDVLDAIRRADQRRLRIRECANAIELSSTGMTRFIDRLESAGLVRREAVPGDRRGAYAAITEEGIALLERMWPIYARGIETYFGKPLDGDTAGFGAALSRISAAAGDD